MKQPNYSGNRVKTLALIAMVCMALVLTAVNINWADTSGGKPKSFEVKGTVLMPDDSKAVGAQVEVLNPSNELEVVASAETDASGSFTVSVPSGDWFLSARSGVLIDMNSSKWINVGANGSITGETKMSLKKGTMVLGGVIDTTTGGMLKGVKIITSEGLHSKTGSDGLFALLVPKGQETITVLKDGFYSPTVNIGTERQDTYALMIETKPEGRIRGRVTDEAGKPISGAWVGSSSGGFHFRNVRTNGNGEYVLTGLDPDARASMGVRADGYTSIYEYMATFPQGQREVVKDFQLKSDKYRNVTGRVTTADGKPVNDARVSFGFASDDANHKVAYTKPDGTYELKMVAVEKSLILVQKDGYAPVFKFVKADANVTVDAVMTEPGHRMEVRIRNDEGKLVETARLSISVETAEMDKVANFMGWERYYRYIQQDVGPDKDGVFRLRDLPSGRVFVDAWADDYCSIDNVSMEVDRNDHVMTMHGPGRIYGTVVSAVDGKPIPEFRVYNSEGEEGPAFNSPDGAFTITTTGRYPGDHANISVEAKGYVRSAGADAVVMPANKPNPKALVIKLKPAPDFVAVITEAGTGKPLEGVAVTVFDADRYGSWGTIDVTRDQGFDYLHPILVRTDAVGKARIKGIHITMGNVMIEKPGYGRVLLRDIGLVRPLRVAMTRAASISAVASDASGKPIADARVDIQLQDSGVTFGRHKTDKNGQVRLTDLSPGIYTVTMRNEGTHIRVIELRAGQDYRVDWSKPGAAEVTGTLTQGGVPVAGGGVLFYYQDQGWISSVAKTDGKGRYSASIPKAGKYNVRFDDGNESFANEVSDHVGMVVKRGKNHLDLALPAGSISGRVIDAATKKPVANTDIVCYQKQTDQQVYDTYRFRYDSHVGARWVNNYWENGGKTKTDADGRFKFTSLLPGECMIVLQNDHGIVPGTPTFSIAKDREKANVTVEIPATGAAQIGFVDSKTGKPIKDIPFYISSGQGLVYAPLSNSSGIGYRGRQEMVRTSDGKFVFTRLVPGKYRIFPEGKYLPSTAGIEVRAGQTTVATVKLNCGGRLVFRFAETADNPLPGIPEIGYTIFTTADHKPVLESGQGFQWGNYAEPEGDAPRESAIPIKPGKYTVYAALITRSTTRSKETGRPIGEIRKDIVVTEGKDTVILLPPTK